MAAAAAAAAALSPERCPGLPSPMQNLTAPGGPGNSNVTCSCNCTASQPQGMEICELTVLDLKKKKKIQHSSENDLGAAIRFMGRFNNKSDFKV